MAGEHYALGVRNASMQACLHDGNRAGRASSETLRGRVVSGVGGDKFCSIGHTLPDAKSVLMLELH